MTKLDKLRRARGEERSLNRTQVSLYPPDGATYHSAQGVTSPRIKKMTDIARIELGHGIVVIRVDDHRGEPATYTIMHNGQHAGTLTAEAWLAMLKHAKELLQ